jgi:hypothetical protein
MDTCAVRKQEMNKRFFGSFMEQISNFLFSCRIKLGIFNMDRKNNILFNNHCKKGFHKYHPQPVIITSYKYPGKTIKIIYHECNLCKTKLFLTPQDLIKFKRFESNKRKWDEEYFGKITKKVK